MLIINLHTANADNMAAKQKVRPKANKIENCKYTYSKKTKGSWLGKDTSKPINK